MDINVITRGYDLGVDVYGPEVAHPTHPAVVLTAGNVTLTVADSWDDLERDFVKVLEMIRTRRMSA